MIVSEINYVEFDRRRSVLTKIFKSSHYDANQREMQANRIDRSYWDPTGATLEREVSWAIIPMWHSGDAANNPPAATLRLKRG